MFEEKLKQLGQMMDKLGIQLVSGVYGITIEDVKNHNSYVSDEKILTSEKLENLDKTGVIIYDYN